MRLPALFLWTILSGYVAIAAGQTANANIDKSPDKSDVHVFRTLFEFDLQLNQMADDAEAVHKPKPHLRKILARKFEISDFDSANLDRFSQAYKQDITPIEAQKDTLIAQFRARFPSRKIPVGADISPPAGLADLQKQENSIILYYRDQLRNSMREADFQILQTKVRQAFGSTATK
jgi:hypothetical protein